jgi:hypothetical protein
LPAAHTPGTLVSPHRVDLREARLAIELAPVPGQEAVGVSTFPGRTNTRGAGDDTTVRDLDV